MTNTPLDPHNLDFNFTQPREPIDAHNLDFNFGADELTSYASLVLDVGITLQATGTVETPVDIRGSADLSLNVEFLLEATGSYDLNHSVGVSCNTGFKHQVAKSAAKIMIASSNRAAAVSAKTEVVFNRGTAINLNKTLSWDITKSLSTAPNLRYEKAKSVSNAMVLHWQITQSLHSKTSIWHQVAQTKSIAKTAKWQQAINLKLSNMFAHQNAKSASKTVVFEWQKGLTTRLNTAIWWQVATPLYYRKNYLVPWQPSAPQKYESSTDFNFVCTCHEIDAHNLDFNFGVDDCLPSIPNKNWWHIVNEVSVSRLDNGLEINAESGNCSCDRQSWCWSYSFVIAAEEKHKIEPVGNQPVILKIMINGNQHLMLVEDRKRNRAFAKDWYTISGRSPTALLDTPYSATRSFLQESDRSSVELAQAEINRSSVPDLQLNWQLVDPTGWQVPSESLSYSNGSPISAIKTVAESGGGFVYSEPSTGALTVKPLYKKVWWQDVQITDFDRLLPISLITDESTNYTKYPDYNCIYLTNDRNGDVYKVVRSGSAEDVQLEMQNSAMFVSEFAARIYGESKLAKSGMIQTYSLQLPIEPSVGQCSPAELVAVNGEYWGVVDSVNISWSNKLVNQTVVIEQGGEHE